MKPWCEYEQCQYYGRHDHPGGIGEEIFIPRDGEAYVLVEQVSDYTDARIDLTPKLGDPVPSAEMVEAWKDPDLRIMADDGTVRTPEFIAERDKAIERLASALDLGEFPSGGPS